MNKKNKYTNEGNLSLENLKKLEEIGKKIKDEEK